mgnify:CR=1 FL=1
MTKTIYWKTGILLTAIMIMAILGFTQVTNAGTVKVSDACSAKWKSTFTMDQNANILKGSYADIYKKLHKGCDFKVVVKYEGEMGSSSSSFYCGLAAVNLAPGGGMDGFECRDSANRYVFRYGPDWDPNMVDNGKSKVEYGTLNNDVLSDVLVDGLNSVFYVFTKG